MNNQENSDSFKTGDRPVESPKNEVVYADFSEMAIDTEYQREASQKYQVFLGDLLRVDGNKEVWDDFLKNNLDKLDDDLAKMLLSLDTVSLNKCNPEFALGIAGRIGSFSSIIKDFQLGSRESNLEIAIAGYQVILKIFTKEAFLETWANTQNNLGNVYFYRIRGDISENLELSIEAYELALEVYEPETVVWAGACKGLGNAYQQKIKGDPSTNFDELGDRLQLNDLIARHLHGIEELIIVPHLLLHLIPFGAIALSDSYLGDKFLIRYAPSCQILEFCHQRGEVDVETFQYGTVEDAEDNLPCAAWEGDRLAELLGIPETNRLRGQTQATCHNYRQLAEKVQVLHSCHHAESRLENPLESVLKLGDGNITLGQLMSPGWRLPHLSDVFLSCCETGLGMPPLTDDILTLAAGFLCAGARSVVNTLWGVDDLAAALVCTFYYRRRLQGESRPQALWGAQMELCNFSQSDFAELSRQVEAKRKEARSRRELYRERPAEYEECDREYKKYLRITNQLSKTPHSSNQPFSHRQYWAAFTSQGLS